MTQPKRPIGINAVSAADVQVLIAENEDLRMQLRIRDRQPPSPNAATPKAPSPTPARAPIAKSEVAWRGVVLWRDDLPTIAGAMLAMLGCVAFVWAIGFVATGFSAANLRGASMVAICSFAWWIVFAKNRR